MFGRGALFSTCILRECGGCAVSPGAIMPCAPVSELIPQHLQETLWRPGAGRLEHVIPRVSFAPAIQQCRHTSAAQGQSTPSCLQPLEVVRPSTAAAASPPGPVAADPRTRSPLNSRTDQAHLRHFRQDLASAGRQEVRQMLVPKPHIPWKMPRWSF